jgi:uncharacterized protein (TIGR02001 family)
MKKIALIVVALVAGASLSAQAPAPAPAPAAPSYSVTADFTYASKYVFRGVQLAKGAFQPSAKLTVGDFYASIWSSMPVDKGYELEFDYTVGYGAKLTEGWALDTGLTVYTYPGLGGGADKATYEGFLGVNGTVGVLTTGTYLYYDFTLKAFTAQEALGYSVTIDPKTSINFLATIGHVAPDEGDSYNYYGFGITVPYKLSDKATVTVGAQYADHDISGLEGSNLWGTLGFTYAF